jgi:biotin-dependent carboxylase-like uncharacterized protein
MTVRAERGPAGGVLVERTGPLVTVQDLGRPGWWSSGVGRSGAADRGSLRLANRLVGNLESAAALEVLLGGVTLRALRPVTMAVTGAPAPAELDGRPVGHAAVLELTTGARLRLGFADTGLRTYLAVRGGLAVPPVLGSRSRDTLSGLGPEPVRAGMVLPVGPTPAQLPLVDLAPLPRSTDEPLTARVILGPRDDWFVDPGLLCVGSWQVSPQADRVGVRLDRAANSGPPLRRAGSRELPTEGTALGAIQVPPDGRPVVFLADHPITGGYPVIAVVVTADVDAIAQARPGRLLRFRNA